MCIFLTILMQNQEILWAVSFVSWHKPSMKRSFSTLSCAVCFIQVRKLKYCSEQHLSLHNYKWRTDHCMKWQVCGQHFRTQHDKDACEKQNNQAQPSHVTQKLVPTLNKVYEPMRTYAMLLPGFCFCFPFWLIKNKDLLQRRILHYGALLQIMQTTLRAHDFYLNVSAGPPWRAADKQQQP